MMKTAIFFEPQGTVEAITTEELPHPQVSSVAPTHGPVHTITMEGTLRKMSPEEKPDPEKITAEIPSAAYQAIW
ncbi:unnamed protein product [Heligmosomoides polygyrus]|uniref:ATP-synt_DE_N domain-containing protein n=1 Tax=Heligmosomoides polygyrus TaxID=6339 RepID=A0A183FPJ8_HELPZ|nr:unnamed protein product [Heligmosomoides polygyrus]